MPRRGSLVFAIVALVATGCGTEPGQDDVTERDRSPVEVVLTPDGTALLTVNQTSDSVSLLDRASGKVLAEVPVGKRPIALAVRGDLVAVVGNWQGDLTLLRLGRKTLTHIATLSLGAWDPYGVALSPDGSRAYVALSTAHQVAEIDLSQRKITHRIDAGRWPRYLALSPDGKRLAVGCNGDGGVSVIDTARRKVDFQESFGGINLGRMVIDRAGKYVWFPWMVYRNNPITPENVELGWVLANRLGRVDLHEYRKREALSLDPKGEATADPHGIALSPDEGTLVCTASGSQELLVFRATDLPLVDYGGPGDHIEEELLQDRQRFRRIPLGGRPMGCVFTPEGKTVLVANYLLNAVQEVDLIQGKIVRTLPLGGPEKPTPARQGEALFFDGKRSLDHWYSCSTCHHEGHINSIPMDTSNDGSFRTFKTVLSLRGVTETAPYFWHGRMTNLDSAVQRSFTHTLLGKELTPAELRSFRAYLETLTPRPNPYRGAGEERTPEAKRGAAVFAGERAGCARCHSGPQFTDGRIHDVGTNGLTDVYPGYGTPSLRGTGGKLSWLHDGRANSLEDLLRGEHAPNRVTGRGDLTPEELADLVAFLRSLP